MTRTSLVGLVLIGVAIPLAVAADDGLELPNGSRVRITKLKTADTLKATLEDNPSQKITVRVLGIDCPNSKKGFAIAHKMLLDEVVTLESDKSFLPILQDRKGNYVAYIALDNEEDYAHEMLLKGVCTDLRWPTRHPRSKLYKDARKASSDPWND